MQSNLPRRTPVYDEMMSATDRVLANMDAALGPPWVRRQELTAALLELLEIHKQIGDVEYRLGMSTIEMLDELNAMRAHDETVSRPSDHPPSNQRSN